MPSGVALAELLSQLRAEVGHSTVLAHGIGAQDGLVQVLRRTQETLAVEHEWPFLQVFADQPFTAGTRYVDYPSPIEPLMVTDAWSAVGSEWRRLEAGIAPEHLSVFDSEADARSWPVERYRHHAPTNQAELWPLPNQDGRVRFAGQAKLRPLVSMADTCTLDSTLIVLTAAAEVLARSKSEDASLKLARANTILLKLRARQGSARRRPSALGGEARPARRPRPGQDYIP